MTFSTIEKLANAPLRVGLLLDSCVVPAWMHQMIENIQASEYATIDLVVLNTNPPESAAENKKLSKKITSNQGRVAHLAVRKALEVVYQKVIERNTYLPPADVCKDATSLLSNAKTLKVTTKKTKWSDYFHHDDVVAIQREKPDILVRCGFGILRGDILNAPKYGIWSYHHGDNNVNRGGPAGFWESMQGWPETGSILQILSEDLDNGKVLYRSFSCTDSMSVEDNKNNYYWKSLLFISRKMEELYRLGEEEFFAKVEQQNLHPSLYSEKLYTQPTNLELVGLTYKKIVKKFVLQYKQIFKMEQWILLFHLSEEFSSSLWRYKKIVPPKDRFWADPHVLYRDGKYYIYIEEYPFETGKGHISLITMDEDGTYTDPVIVLEKDYHLSYPFVFEYENTTYMIPESIENGTVELYECVNFPDKWIHKINLLENIQAVDATLLEHNGKWWLFASVAEQEGMTANDELFIFYADSPLTNDWQAHELNPVISDCKLARPAGKIFSQNGRLYRPSQNCSVRYGYGFNFNEIELLTEHEYKETPVTKALPNWEKNILGTHTFNRAGNLHVIDALVETTKR